MTIHRLSTLLVALLYSTSSDAFAPFSSFAGGGRTLSSPLNMAIRPDTSQAIEEALKVSAAFGLDSSEAAAAWDIVEEMDASDNSEATKGSLDEECEVENVSPECLDYGAFLEQLDTIRKTVGPPQSDKRKPLSLVETFKMIKIIQTPESDKMSGSNSAQLETALQEATAATEEFGITSTQAKLAWETYEEIASADSNNNAVGINLMEECTIEAETEEACRAIEEIQRVLPVLKAIYSFDQGRPKAPNKFGIHE